MSPGIALNLIVQPRPLKTEEPADSIPRTEYVTLVHRGLLNLNGERFRLVSRADSARWSVARLEKDRLSANFQGNPLWPQRVLVDYPALSALFSLSGSSSEMSCVLPMASTANAALACLLGPGGYAFKEHHMYRRDWNGVISAREYVDTFIDSGLLPMADIEDRDSIHDWAYHFVTFLFPEYLDHVRDCLRFIRENMGEFRAGVTRYAWNYYGHALDGGGKMQGSRIIEEMSHAEAVYRQMAIALDVATAKFVQLLGLEQQGLLERCKGEIDSVGVFMSGVTQAALDKILWMEPSIVLRAPVPGKPSVDTMAYIKETLRRHELRARSLVCTESQITREQIFSQILRELDF